MKINTAYDLEEMVYLKSDPEQNKRLIIEMSIMPGMLQYRLACGTEFSWHYEFEISRDKNILIGV